MFLELSTMRVSVPESNEVSLVFPFNQFCCKFKRNCYDSKYLDQVKYSKQQANDFIDKIESTCGNFKKIRKYAIIAMVECLLFVIFVCVGNVLLNIGLTWTGGDTDEVELTKWKRNGLVIAGSCVLGLGIIQCFVVIIILALKVRKVRINYESLTARLIQQHNQELKELGIRWKIGQYYNWIEMCLDYKINAVIAKNSFSPRILSKMGTADSQKLLKNCA